MFCLFAGEKLYIGYVMNGVSFSATVLQSVGPYTFLPGIISPSRDSITFIDYNSDAKELPVEGVSIEGDFPCHILTSKTSDILYWEPSEKFADSCSLPNNILMVNNGVNVDTQCVLFIAQVPPTVVQDGRVIGTYDKAKFPVDFNGPIVGFGQAWMDDDFWENHSADLCNRVVKAFHVNVLYDGKIFETSNFSFLCVYEIPELTHCRLSETNWEAVSDGPLPPNALPAGVYPDGQILYIGSKQHNFDKVPGYVVDSVKWLHLCWGCNEHCYDKGYEILVTQEVDSFDWGVYSNGEVPPTAVSGGETNDEEKLYIGRTLSNGDVTLGRTWLHEPINLPYESVINTQLVGKIHPSHGCLYVPWDGKEYRYTSYEVLIARWQPKSLQHLCRNTIISATLAVPDRVDKLSLPEHLKDFCKVLVNNY